MKKVLISLLLGFLLVFGFQYMSFSQNSPDSSSQIHSSTSTHEDHTNWGLLGLVGLIGLSGLGKKKVIDPKIPYTNPENRPRR